MTHTNPVNNKQTTNLTYSYRSTLPYKNYTVAKASKAAFAPSIVKDIVGAIIAIAVISISCIIVLS